MPITDVSKNRQVLVDCFYILSFVIFIEDTGLLAQLLSAHTIDAGGLEFNSHAGQIRTVSPTVRHRCDVFFGAV